MEEAVRAFVQGHGPVGVGFGEGEGGVVGCLEVTHALGTLVRGVFRGVWEWGLLLWMGRAVGGEEC